jgi:alpha-ribazole phosphatase CobZ
METEICIDDAIVEIDLETFSIQRKNGFLAIGNTIVGGGITKVRTILSHTIPPENHFILQNINEQKKLLELIIKNKRVLKPVAAMINTLDINKSFLFNYDDISILLSVNPLKSSYVNHNEFIWNFFNTSLLINRGLSYKSLVNIIIKVNEVKNKILWDLDVKNCYYKDISSFNIQDSYIIACLGEVKVINDTEELGILNSIENCLDKAIRQVVKNCGFPKSILDYINCAGINIDDLVEAGMELCVGVDKTDELHLRLKNEILKALKDINVVSYVIAGIRLEEDYKKDRIRDVDIKGDPAYLFADEVIGMAIANHIAGTKAIFNFKRYDEEKPGIIGELGPFLDDVFAGVVAGCMSKVFEE